MDVSEPSPVFIVRSEFFPAKENARTASGLKAPSLIAERMIGVWEIKGNSLFSPKITVVSSLTSSSLRTLEACFIIKREPAKG